MSEAIIYEKIAKSFKKNLKYGSKETEMVKLYKGLTTKRPSKRVVVSSELEFER
jgi:hypothetical protein